jgi:hypothetical protein
MNHDASLLVVLKLIHMMLTRATEDIKKDLPKEYHLVSGFGTTVVPQLSPLYELLNVIDNLVFILGRKS